jgi:hypothetical protein
MNAMLYLHFDVQGALLEQARQCEQDVFLRAFGNTPEQLADEYGPYENQSLFIAVSDDAGYVYGSCRVILPGPAGLKTLNDIGREPWLVDGERAARAAGVDPTRAWDIGTLGVREGHRGPNMMVSLGLYHGILKSTYINEVPSMLSVMDDHARRVLGAFDYVYPALPGTGTASYLGSGASTPVYCHASMLDVQRQLNPDAYRLLSLGVGLDGLSTPTDDEYRLASLVPALPGVAAA